MASAVLVKHRYADTTKCMQRFNCSLRRSHFCYVILEFLLYKVMECHIIFFKTSLNRIELNLIVKNEHT